MKTLEVVIQRAYLVMKKCKFSQKFCKMTTNFQIFWNNLELSFHYAEKSFSKLKTYQFVTWAVSKNPKIPSFVISLAPRNAIFWFFVAIWAENLKCKTQNWGTSINFGKNENLTKNCHFESVKNQRCWALKQRSSALILSFEIFHFQRCSEIFR